MRGSEGVRRKVRERFVKWLRRARPRRDDKLLVLARGDVQSFATVSLLFDVERDYETRIEVLEISPDPVCREVCGQLGLSHTAIAAEWRSYTELRLAAVESLRERPKDYLLVMPDTVEDIALYLVGEVVLGDVRGLELDAKFRVAYPLASVSVRDLARVYPHLCGKLPRAFTSSTARELLEELALSTPTLYYSAVSSYFSILKALTRAGV